MLDGSDQDNVLAERRAQRQLEDRGAVRVEDVGACVDVLLTTPSQRWRAPPRVGPLDDAADGRRRRGAKAEIDAVAAHSNMMEAHPGPSRQPRQC